MAGEAKALADRLVSLLDFMKRKGWTDSQMEQAFAEECRPYSRGVVVQAMNVMKQRS